MITNTTRLAKTSFNLSNICISMYVLLQQQTNNWLPVLVSENEY